MSIFNDVDVNYTLIWRCIGEGIIVVLVMYGVTMHELGCYMNGMRSMGVFMRRCSILIQLK